MKYKLILSYHASNGADLHLEEASLEGLVEIARAMVGKHTYHKAQLFGYEGETLFKVLFAVNCVSEHWTNNARLVPGNQRHLPAINKDTRGVTALEYGLIAALIAVVILGSVSLVGTRIKTTFSTVNSSISAANSK